MNILKNLFLSLFLALSSLFLMVPKANAGDFCTGLYGGNSSCIRITIDKKVQKPGSLDFVDNLTVYDSKYNPNDTVAFKITVQNTGDKPINDLNITDTLPKYSILAAGQTDFSIDTLNPGESKTYDLSVKVSNDIPVSSNGYMCVTNYVLAKEANGASADDSSQFCVTKVYKPVLGLKKTPPTGPEAIAIPSLFAMAGAGWFLRKKIKI